MRYLLTILAVILIIACSKSEDSTTQKDPIQSDEPSSEEPEGNEPQGSPADSILSLISITPEFADLGDTLALKGKNFNRYIRLSLGQRQLKILFNNDSIVRFELPYWGFDPDSLHLVVDNLDTLANFRDAFRLYQPEVDSIPGDFGFRDTVVVYGKHLTNQPNQIDGILEINNQAISVIDQNKDSIRFVLPNNLDRHENNLLVRAQLREILKEKGVVIPNPQIQGFSKDSIQIGDEITIYGSYFYPENFNYNEVLFDGKNTEILHTSKDSIVFRVPLGPYEGRNIGGVTVNVLGKEVTQDSGMILKDKWYLYGYKKNGEISSTAGVGQISRSSFYYNDAFYFSVYDHLDGYPNFGGSNYRIYKYSPTINLWEQQMDIPIDVQPGGGEWFQIFPDSDGTVYLYINREINNFYKYNFQSGSLQQLADFNAGFRLGDAIGFLQNGNFYMGAGYASEFERSTYTANRKMWKYSTAMDSWIEISEIPIVPGQYEYAYYSNLFKQDGKFYICNGDRAYETWEFTPDETWVRKSDLVNPISQTVYTQIGGMGYFYHYFDRLFYEYDIANDKWSRREDLLVDAYNPSIETIFVHDGFVYLIGYKNGYPPEYNGFSSGDHLILRTEISNFSN